MKKKEKIFRFKIMMIATIALSLSFEGHSQWTKTVTKGTNGKSLTKTYNQSSSGTYTQKFNANSRVISSFSSSASNVGKFSNNWSLNNTSSNATNVSIKQASNSSLSRTNSTSSQIVRRNSSKKEVKSPEGFKETSRAARLEATRQHGIPTSQQPWAQVHTESGRDLIYKVPKKGGGTRKVAGTTTNAGQKP